jgi:hypothetical protein
VQKYANLSVSHANCIRVGETQMGSARTFASRIRDTAHNCVLGAILENLNMLAHLSLDLTI